MRVAAFFAAVTGLALLAAPASARALVEIYPNHFSLVPEQCWGKACTRRVDFTCGPPGTVKVAVDIPWSRRDLWPANFAGERARITFGDAGYRTTYDGQIVVYYRSRNVARVTVVTLAQPTDELFTLLQTSSNIYVAGQYGSYRVRTRGLAPRIAQIRAACGN